MRESMVSLERRVPHASEAMVPLERGVIAPLKGGPFRWRGLACAWLREETQDEAAGGRRVCLSRSQAVW